MKTVPPYVDTETAPRQWYVYHLSILVASLAMLAIAALVIEYEVAKMTHPGVSFLLTPTTLDLTLSTIVVVLALANLSVLIFVFLRHLWLRKWMLATTIIGWMLVAVMALALGYNFLPLILPWYR